MRLAFTLWPVSRRFDKDIFLGNPCIYKTRPFCYTDENVINKFILQIMRRNLFAMRGNKAAQERLV